MKSTKKAPMEASEKHKKVSDYQASKGSKSEIEKNPTPKKTTKK
jgi:hypothetical protein